MLPVSHSSLLHGSFHLWDSRVWIFEGLSDSFYPGPVLASHAPSFINCFAPDTSEMGPSLAAWMKRSDWKSHRPQGWLLQGQAHCRKTASFWKGQNPPVPLVWASPLGPSVPEQWQPMNRGIKRTDLKANLFFATNLLSDPKQVSMIYKLWCFLLWVVGKRTRNILCSAWVLEIIFHYSFQWFFPWSSI